MVSRAATSFVQWSFKVNVDGLLYSSFKASSLLSPKCENEHHQKNVLSPLSANVQQCRPAELLLLCNIGASSPEEKLATR